MAAIREIVILILTWTLNYLPSRTTIYHLTTVLTMRFLVNADFLLKGIHQLSLSL